jgi:hypothetical protein
MSIRTLMRDRPMLGWILAGFLLVAAAFFALRALRGPADPYSFQRLTEDVTIKDRETGEEWKIKRGRMEQMLWDRGDKLDTNVGLPNPRTGTLTGFPKSDWEATVERINRDRVETAQAYGGHIPTSSAAPAKKPAAPASR